MTYTVLGSQGFIGGQVAAVLRQRGHNPFTPKRDEDLSGQHLGRVIYCIGLTADFRKRPLDTVEAHVCVLNRILRDAQFDRLVYLSSTRVYAGLSGLVNEVSRLGVDSGDPSDLYNISKIMGESVCLHSGRDAVVARLSNVVGADFSSDNFLSDLIREACDNKVICLRSAPESVKDYILVNNAVQAIIALAEHPNPKPIYNVAAGRNLSNARICEAIAKVQNFRLEVAPGAPLLDFPNIDVSLARQELGLVPDDVLKALGDLVSQYSARKA